MGDKSGERGGQGKRLTFKVRFTLCVLTHKVSHKANHKENHRSSFIILVERCLFSCKFSNDNIMIMNLLNRHVSFVVIY
jgi:hypothetical protein